MSSIASPVEFSISKQYQTKRTGPLVWITSHVARYWYLIVSLLIGAVGNAALAALVPVYIGEAINSIRQDPTVLTPIIRYALLIAGTQVLRGHLQLGRNFSTELISQRLERDIRDELYRSEERRVGKEC